MSKYADVLLVEEPDGTPHVVIAPGCTSDVGHAVAFNGTMGTIVRKVYMDTESEEYAILSAMIPVHPADATYSPRYERKADDAP